MAKRLLHPLALIAFALSPIAVAGDLESGLRVGETARAFDVTDCTGPSAGTSLCYFCQYGLRPVVNVFTRSLTDELGSLVQQLDAQVAQNRKKSMRGFVVLLTDDPESAEAELKAFAKKHGIEHMPLTYFDGITGPRNYHIARNAEVTVNMWVEAKSKANHAFVKGELNDAEIAKVVSDTAKILN